MTDLASLFECPICFDHVLPPILQCEMGHIICNNCRSKLTRCPKCRGPLGDIRNLAMDSVADKVSFPCTNNGCTSSFRHTEKTNHEKICNFRPYPCPAPRSICKWQGSLTFVMPHLIMHHQNIVALEGEDIVFLATNVNSPAVSNWTMIQSCLDRNFLLVLEKKQKFFFIVALIGSTEDAESVVYRIELNGNRRRATWEALPKSIHDGIKDINDNNDYFSFDQATANLFTDNGNLSINVTISKT